MHYIYRHAFILVYYKFRNWSSYWRKYVKLHLIWPTTILYLYVRKCDPVTIESEAITFKSYAVTSGIKWASNCK